MGADGVVDWEALARDAPAGAEALAALCDGGAPGHVMALGRPGGTAYVADAPIPARSVVVPGSFNPMHEGHERLGAEAAALVGRPGEVLFELCVSNADKGAQPMEELQRRVEGVVGRGHRLLITRAALYVDKASLCRDCDFVVGYDTYRRIVNPKYYAPPGADAESSSDEERRSWVAGALRELKDRGARLLVAGRAEADGSFLDLETASLFDLPEDMAGMILPLPNFRMDISSTELRREMAERQKAEA